MTDARVCDFDCLDPKFHCGSEGCTRVLDQYCPVCEAAQTAGNLAFEEANRHEEKYDDTEKDLEVMRG